MTVRRIGQSCVAMAICLAASASGQTQNGEWRSYGGDPGSMKNAPLDQINKTNVSTLRIAWSRPAATGAWVETHATSRTASPSVLGF